MRRAIVSTTLTLGTAVFTVCAGCGGSSQGAGSDASAPMDSMPASEAGDEGESGSPIDAGGVDGRVAGAGDTGTIDASAKDASLGDASDGGSACHGPPPGATALGYGTLVFCLEPTTADISYTSAGATSLYSGQWYDTMPPDSTYYSMENGTLAIALGGGVTTQRQSSQQGTLPYLVAGNGFYVEFAVTLSDNDSDHWPAVWLMPQEHNDKQSDHLSTDPAGYERWMEVDCDEGGFYAGSLNSLINWQGIYPNYTNTTWNDEGKLPALDRTTEHVFGVSYDPVGQMAAYWLDGASVYSHSTSTIPAIVNTYHYYLIAGAQTHGANKPYEMLVRYMSAWIK
jgi:hypothetical protein